MLEWKQLKILFDTPLDLENSTSALVPFDRYSQKGLTFQAEKKDSDECWRNAVKSFSENHYLDLGQILFRTPPWDWLDWEHVDVILISSEQTALALPYITQYTGFQGKIYATEPVIEMMRFLMEELCIWCSLSKDPSISLSSIQ